MRISRRFAAMSAGVGLLAGSFTLATPASASLSQCTTNYYACTWSNTSYTGTFKGNTGTPVSNACYQATSYFRSAKNYWPLDNMNIYSNTNCTGSLKILYPGNVSGDIGLLGKSVKWKPLISTLN